MLELPPAAAEELARRTAEKLHYLPFVFGVYEQSVGIEMSELMSLDAKAREQRLRLIAAISIDAVKVIMEEYK
jgi:hypothetical protein